MRVFFIIFLSLQIYLAITFDYKTYCPHSNPFVCHDYISSVFAMLGITIVHVILWEWYKHK